MEIHLVNFEGKKNMIRKTLSLILILVISISFVSCGALSGMSSELVIEDDNGNPCINALTFKEIITQIELTSENWQEYVFVYSYEMPETDSAGDIISDNMVTRYRLGAGTEKYYAFMHGTTLELKKKENEQLKTFDLGTSGVGVEESFSLDDYEFISITGYLYFIDPPEEVISQDEDGRLEFTVFHSFPSNSEMTVNEKIRIDTYTNTFRPVEYIDAVYNTPQN